MLNKIPLLLLDMVQLEQYDAAPSVSVEPEVHVEVNFQLNIFTP